MRKEDHQALLPLVVATVSKDAKYKVDGTDMGFKPITPDLRQGRREPGAAELQDGAPAGLSRCTVAAAASLARMGGVRASRHSFSERGAWNSSSSRS